MNLDNIYLNLTRVFDLPDKQSTYIQDIYRDMISANEDSRTKLVTAYYNTLFENGYLLDKRDQKIDKVLDE